MYIKTEQSKMHPARFKLFEHRKPPLQTRKSKADNEMRINRIAPTINKGIAVKRTVGTAAATESERKTRQDNSPKCLPKKKSENAG